jgi:hypothetical protein
MLLSESTECKKFIAKKSLIYQNNRSDVDEHAFSKLYYGDQELSLVRSTILLLVV